MTDDNEENEEDKEDDKDEPVPTPTPFVCNGYWCMKNGSPS